MGGNIPDGNFVDGDFHGGGIHQWGVRLMEIFRVGVFLIPRSIYKTARARLYSLKNTSSLELYRTPGKRLDLINSVVSFLNAVKVQEITTIITRSMKISCLTEETD